MPHGWQLDGASMVLAPSGQKVTPMQQTAPRYDGESHGEARHTSAKTTPYRSNELFRRLSSKFAHGVGSPWAFFIALALVLVWGLTGPFFHYSDTWQLVINTSTTIVTFLMVFLIQNTQNRDSHALHIKLDELIRANKLARNSLIEAEELTDAEIKELQEEFHALAAKKIEHKRRHSAHDREDQKLGTSNISSSTTGERSSRAMNRMPASER
jgi:low affinity Fe/Cu permease